HTPDDTPDKLDYPKIAATARWLTRFVRTARVRDDTCFQDGRLDLGTLDEVAEILGALAPLAPEATAGLQQVRRLRAACDRDGNLPAAQRDQLAALVAMLEDRLQ
ncbi:MAG TPA: hypothetical protein VF469_20105, partial [Kofleriaceae bacterium]